jgi:exodeoxyribonuclease V
VTWGYCLTAHKAQGSQWNDILVVDESYCFREMASRWAYTAITRAVERVTIARGTP